MKKIFLVAALAAATVLASCSKDDNGASNQGGTVTVTLKGSTSGTTRADAVTTETETKEASIFLFHGDALVAKTHLSAKGSYTFQDVTTGTNSVYVVGNAGDITAQVTDLASFKALKHTLVADASSMVLQGNAAISFATVNGDLVATPSVSLRPLASRIDVTIKKGANATGLDGTKLQLKDVSLLYSALENHFAMQSGTLGGDGSDWVNAPAEGAADYAYYRSGLNPAAHTSWSLNSNNALYSGAKMVYPFTISDFGAPAPLTFYGYPGNGAYGKHAIVTLRGEWKNDDNTTKELFFSAHFKNIGVPLFENGRYYTITLTLNGKYNGEDDDTGGEDDPEDESTTGNVIIEIGDGQWIVVAPVETVFE